jgi:hypothetical protein
LSLNLRDEYRLKTFKNIVEDNAWICVGDSTFERPRLRRGDNIKTVLKAILCKFLDGIHLALVWDKLWVVLNTEINFRVAHNALSFLTT